MPITKDILKQINNTEPVNIEKLNINVAFKVTWSGFLRLSEITYTENELKKASFLDTTITRSDLSFSEENQYEMLRVKQSKTDTRHTGVRIILAATDEKTYPVAALIYLYIQDPQLVNTPLLCLSSSAFSRFSVVMALKKYISLTSLAKSDYSGHNFCKGAAQQAPDHGMLDEIIQKLRK